jgi:hypothetical protein
LVNSIIEGPAAKALVVPSRSIQSIGETIVTVMILFMGLIGAYLLYESGKAQSAKKQWVGLRDHFHSARIRIKFGTAQIVDWIGWDWFELSIFDNKIW